MRFSKIIIEFNRVESIYVDRETFGGEYKINYKEILTVDRINETIVYKRNVFSGNQICVKYHLQELVKAYFDEIDATTVFTLFNDSSTDIVEDGVFTDYKITVMANNMPKRVISGKYCYEYLPKDYSDFINLVVKSIETHGTWGNIFDPSIYLKPSRKKSDLIFCAVEFSHYGGKYHYLTDDDSINEFDEVIVPVGIGNKEVKATVVEKIYATEEDAPFTVSKIKKIIRKVDKKSKAEN